MMAVTGVAAIKAGWREVVMGARMDANASGTGSDVIAVVIEGFGIGGG